MFRFFKGGSNNSWAGAVVRLLGVAEQSGGRVVGVTSSRHGAGVSRIAYEIAAGYARVGKSALLVRAGDVTSLGARRAGAQDVQVPLQRSLSGPVTPAIWDMSNTPDHLADAPHHLRQLLDASFSAAVIDLPPITRSPGVVDPVFAALGALCDSVVLVCVTGGTTRLELNECTQLAKISQVNLTGVVLNDWDMPAATMLELPATPG